MYAFTPDQPLCLVYEDFYLTIGYTFYEFITIEIKNKKADLLKYKSAFFMIKPVNNRILSAFHTFQIILIKSINIIFSYHTG